MAKPNKQSRAALLTTFIELNNLYFQEGSRNADSVIISGYALFIGVRSSYEISAVIDEIGDADHGYEVELHRVFDYAEANDYGSWWGSTEAHDTYTF